MPGNGCHVRERRSNQCCLAGADGTGDTDFFVGPFVHLLVLGAFGARFNTE